MLTRLLLLIPLLLFSQKKNDLICGKWLEEEKQSHIEIYKTSNNLYEGKIVWLAEPWMKMETLKLIKKTRIKN